MTSPTLNPTAEKRLNATSGHYVGIQILRGLASLLVVLHHAGQQAELAFHSQLDWLHRGGFGVDLFFPISGFVIYLSTESLLRKQPENAAKDFTARRLIRIVPLYWLFTLAKIAVVFIAPSFMRNYQFGIRNAIASLLFQFSYNVHGTVTPVLPVGWTLNYEMLFYGVVLFGNRFPETFACVVLGGHWCDCDLRFFHTASLR